MIYIAQPYSHPDPAIMRYRYNTALRVCALLRKRFPYSPIVHWHNVAQAFILPTEADFWLELNIHMIEKSRAVYVLDLEGWEQSRGLFSELNYCEKAGKAVLLTQVHNEGLDSWVTSPTTLLERMEHGKDNSERSTDGRSVEGHEF